MRKRMLIHLAAVLFCAGATACSGGGIPERTGEPERGDPVRVLRTVGGITFGEPRAITADFEGNLLVVDGVPGRVVRLDPGGAEAVEFQRPTGSPGFYPSDAKLSGFFVYVLDEVGRALLRFDRHGAYRDQLLNFDALFEPGRVAPAGFDVDRSGRIAVCDARGHQVILFSSFLDVELVFGGYGSYPGQFNAPQGVIFTPSGDLLVADSGNRRVQLVDPSGRFLRSYPAPGVQNPMVKPRRARLDEDGNIVVADPAAGAVFIFDAQGGYVRSIALPDASFKPADVIAASGVYFVADAGSGAIMVFR